MQSGTKQVIYLALAVADEGAHVTVEHEVHPLRRDARVAEQLARQKSDFLGPLGDHGKVGVGEVG